jgi:hypothetical protein
MNFIIYCYHPGTTPIVQSQIHRSICRRSERQPSLRNPIPDQTEGEKYLRRVTVCCRTAQYLRLIVGELTERRVDSAQQESWQATPVEPAGLFLHNRFKEVFVVKHLMRLNLGLGLWLIIAPFVLVFVNQAELRFLWQDFLLGLGIVTVSLWRLSSSAGAAFADFLIMALGLTTLLNPILYHYLNVKAAAWNNLAAGSLVLILGIYQARKDSQILKAGANRE